MARLMLRNHNVLALDEPTNHMDIKSKDILKQALREFGGTLIVVSHDREFLDGLVDKLYEFKGGKVKEHLGGVSDFLRKKRLGSLRDLERKDLAQSPAVTVAPESDRKTTAKEDFQKRKAAAREERKIRSQVSFLESEIARFEEDMKKIEQILANPGENDDILALTTTYLDDKRNVEIMTEEWGKLIEKLEE